MKVLISGGSGLIGSALCQLLIAQNHQVWVLTRNPLSKPFVAGATAIKWDAQSSDGWLSVFEEMDAVINLAGSSIGAWPWHAARKAEILNSRVHAGQAITQAFQQARRRPEVLIQASGVGYYGACDSTVVNEQSSAGNDFLAEVAIRFEKATQSVENLGVRRVVIRSGIVLDSKGGSLPLMAIPIRLFIGGRLGMGQQGLPWIHLLDEVRAISYLINNKSANGVYNLTAPELVSSNLFMRALAKALRRPYWFPTPELLLRLVLGDMADLLLTGQYALPERLINSGFEFKFSSLDIALADLFD